MKSILNDINTFRPIPVDETLQQEDRLYRKLISLKQSGFITPEEFQRCRPVGSQPARIYGLPKVHKTGTPLRPILSAIGTYNYGIAKIFHHSIKFTFEEENNMSLPFLDVMIKRNQQLTIGALVRYLCGNTSEKAILQVVGIKVIEKIKNDDTSIFTKYYHLILSDDKHTFSSCMLDTKINKLIEMNSLKENSIIRIDRVMVNSIDKTEKIMLVLYELEVIQSDSERIGDLVALSLTDITNSGGDINFLETTNDNNTTIKKS
ncbi:unnamed protein product, partial [Rotaria sordida]